MTTSAAHWIEGARPRTLPAAVAPVLAGTGLAVYDHGFVWWKALLALVVVEVINATSGIGHMITLASNYGQTDIIVVGLVVYALLGVTADAVVRLIERKALSWRRTLAS